MWTAVVVLRREWRVKGRTTFGLVAVGLVDCQTTCRIGQRDYLSLLEGVEGVQGFVVAVVHTGCWTWVAGIEEMTGIPSMR